ncbi:SDR family oxidoreductase [Saccharothrix syringae]|uniref:SDR family oxidoreductase n=1 Tax=Saccharothrix syringae TaxID=103733 RepID=A0A5Q0GZ66_SACSY|nr:SDR family oxidoreductase [Saccharothrix syringae]QFZ18820.1 SDR family oxidoreductase [Saccharothrix syringae]
MTHDLTGRTAVVTGAASGIGAETALVLARSGARVALLARREERISDLAGRITAEGGRALAVPADVTADLSGAVDAVHAGLGRVDLVVNNAGVLVQGAFAEGDPRDWDRMVDTNLKGVLNATRAFTADLVAAGADGVADLVNISSAGAHSVYPGFGVYTATKAAVSHLSAGLRAELGPLGVRVTTVEPGLVATEMLSEYTGNPDVPAEALAAHVPCLVPADVADLVAYAASRPEHVNLKQLVVMSTRQPG